MTTALDRALRKAATGALKALGTDITYRAITPGTYSTTSGGATDTETDTTIKARVLDERDLDALGLTKVADKAVLISGNDVSSPSTQDRFVVDSVVYTVSAIDRIRGQDVGAAFVLHGHGPPA